MVKDQKFNFISTFCLHYFTLLGFVTNANVQYIITFLRNDHPCSELMLFFKLFKFNGLYCTVNTFVYCPRLDIVSLYLCTFPLHILNGPQEAC